MAEKSAEELFRMACMRHRAGQLSDAESIYRQLLAQHPDHPDVLHMMGLLAYQQGRIEAAIASIERAIAIHPKSVEYRNNLGIALAAHGQMVRAIAAFRAAIQLGPSTEVPVDHEKVMETTVGTDGAGAANRATIRRKPGFADAHNNLGNALQHQGQLDEAIDAYRTAIEMRPDMSEAYNNLARTLKQQARLDEALECYRRAIALDPSSAMVHSNLLYLLQFHPGFDPISIHREHQVFHRRHIAPLTKFIERHGNTPDPDRRLRIGYVSPDFCHHAECFFVLPLLENHDHARFEIHCYALVRKPDEITDRLRKAADVWHDVLALSTEALAGKIQADQIDILVDLTMHMRDNRLLVFGRKPAPIQASWLAYPCSTGLETMDYRITDDFMEPGRTDPELWTDRPMRLDGCWCSYYPVGEAPPVNHLPALQKGHVTFGSLNNYCKINPQVLDLWANVMLAVPNSRLLLLSPAGEHCRRTDHQFQSRGIAKDRIEFLEPCPRSEYLSLYNRIDIGLDPFPYNGITTTCDALWMGVPVLTLPGIRPASRAGLSLLTAAGLTEFVANTSEEFVSLARRTARELDRLASIRTELRERVKTSPLLDANRFARNMETAYRQMWRTWCAGQRSDLRTQPDVVTTDASPR